MLDIWIAKHGLSIHFISSVTESISSIQIAHIQIAHSRKQATLPKYPHLDSLDQY